MKEEKKNPREIKGWMIKCSWNCLVIKAFEEKSDALDELKRIRKVSKEDGLGCTHKLIPCLIKILSK